MASWQGGQYRLGYGGGNNPKILACRKNVFLSENYPVKKKFWAKNPHFVEI